MEEVKTEESNKEEAPSKQRQISDASSERRELRLFEPPQKDSTSKETIEALTWATCAAEAALTKKASNVVIIEVKPSLVIVDYFIVITADNTLQFNAISGAVEEALREQYGIKPIGREGEGTASWTLLDYGDIVVHIFNPETRDFYRLEKLYNDAEIIEF